MDDEVDDIDELLSQPLPWSPSRIVATAAAGLVALSLAVAGGIAAHPHARPHARQAQPKPAPAPAPVDVPSTPAYEGSVFLEPLEQCLQTDHLHNLRLALQVTNLTNGSLRLVTATPVSSLPDTHVTQLRYWARPCGTVVTDRSPTLPPSGHIIVAITFSFGASCPAATTLGAVITFDARGKRLQTESSSLADLSHVHFVQCKPS